jgi:polysaccharide biosynthesis/export protein
MKVMIFHKCVSLLILLLAVVGLNAQSPDQGKNTQPAASDGIPPASAPAVVEAGQQGKTYTIGNDDVLIISVWKEPDVSRTLPVRSDGKISLPLVGEVQATGQTPSQLEQTITGKLQNYITNPQVTVMVQQINSEKYNILGQVAKPGAYSLTQSTTVLDAIAAAGGFRDFAKQTKIYILRPNTKGEESRILFNYKDVINGKHLEQNIKLESRDTVVVP